jgi:tRNA A37 threonylcarbamoyladenosine dehydratase
LDNSGSYARYKTRPRKISIGSGQEHDVIVRSSDGRVMFRPSQAHDLDFSEITLDWEYDIFDLLPATHEGLLDDLVPGSELGERFQNEWGDFDPTRDPFEDMSRGVWFFYPQARHLVRYSNSFWHRLALVMRNSTLQRDPEMRFRWDEIRERMEKVVIAVAGCSIGSVALHAAVRDLRPKHIKVADYKDFHLTNANRVALGYDEFRNKAVVTAEQLNRIDPFLAVSVFEEGIHEENGSDFLAGNAYLQEPPASVLIEEMDDIQMKIRLREIARTLRIPVVMMTDIGSAAQLDVRRFDRSDDLTLIFGITDEKLHALKNRFEREKSREAWYEFFVAVVGRGATDINEFRRIIFKEDPPLFGGAPQLGSTVMTASGIAAEAVVRLVLGFALPERMFFNKHTGEVRIEGKRI